MTDWTRKKCILLLTFASLLSVNSFAQKLIYTESQDISLEDKTHIYEVNFEKIQNWIQDKKVSEKYRILLVDLNLNNKSLDHIVERKIAELRFVFNREIINKGWKEAEMSLILSNSLLEFQKTIGKFTKSDIEKLLLKVEKDLSKNVHEEHLPKSIGKKVKIISPKDAITTPEAPGQMCTNPDFGLCNFTNWELVNGVVNTSTGPYSFDSPVASTVYNTVNFLGGGITSQHNITNGGTDPNSGQPMVFPGGSCSALLGDAMNASSSASKLKQTFLVDNSSSILTMNYHVILEDPAHLPAEQPYFQIKVFDQNGALISCASYAAFANDGQPGWTPYGTSPGLIDGYFLPWTTVILPLTSYIGQNITVEATVGDCTLGGHFGYAYVDFDCQPVTFNVSGASPCNGPYTLEGPDGGLAYNWSSGQTTQGITVTSLGYYSVNITPLTGGACTIFLDTLLTGWPQFTTYANFTNPSICEGENTKAWIDSSITSYVHQWILPDGSTYNGHSFSINNATMANAGLYQVITLDTISLCVDTADVLLVVNQVPVLSASDETICFGENTIISASGAANFIWNNGLGAGFSHTVSPLDTTQYTYTGTDANGCISTGSLVVNVNPLPDIFAGNDTVVCENGTAILFGQGGISYVWDQGVTNGISFSPTQTLNYTVTGTDSKGCVNSDVITISWEALPIINIMSDIVEGCQPLNVNFTNLSTGNLENCTWSFEGGSILTGCDEIEMIFGLPGYYDVSLTSTTYSGCSSSATFTDYIYVEEFPIADFSIVQDENSITTMVNTADLINNTTGAVSYLWDFNDGSPNSTAFSPSHNFPINRGGIYPIQLIAYSPLGCPDTAYQSVKVEGILLYFVPNTFTPDKDEFNNVFYPIITSGIDAFSYTFTIYNRWGEILFETKDIHTGWDGTYKGELVNSGSYNWKMRYKTTESDEKKIVTGLVNLLR